jgi:hypothetical protein
MPRGLTVLAPIRRGEEAPLRDVLRAIGNDIKGRTAAGGAARPHVDFAGSASIHFARFAILRDPSHGPDAARLLFSSNYDGSLDAHLDELVRITSDMDAIWGRCEGYRGVDAFPAFIRTRMHEPEAFYIAFREESADSIRRASALSQRVRGLAAASPASALEALTPRGADRGGRGSSRHTTWVHDGLPRDQPDHRQPESLSALQGGKHDHWKPPAAARVDVQQRAAG